jgi:hypothetical protein
MYPYRSPYPVHDQRFFGFGLGLPLLGGFLGGLLGGGLGAAIATRPLYGGYGYPGYGYPPMGYPGLGYPPGFGAPYYY